MEGKGGREEEARLSSGQVQLRLNCLASELEHPNVPGGGEEWSVDRAPSPPKPCQRLFFVCLLPSVVNGVFHTLARVKQSASMLMSAEEPAMRSPDVLPVHAAAAPPPLPVHINTTV